MVGIAVIVVARDKSLSGNFAFVKVRFLATAIEASFIARLA